MELSREAILHETHYGLTVYAHILRQYYSGESVLSLSGRDCQPAKNPFNGNKRTLQVSINENCARHTDIDDAIPAGDVFDFAQLHYNLNDLQLLQKINEDLHLRIGEDRFLHRSAKAKRLDQECQQITVPEFSFFKRPVSNVMPAKTISLLEVYELLRCDRYKARTEKLRSLEQKDEARAFKAVSFDYVTFSGTFNKRSDKELISHSGLLTIDFDHIKNIQALKQKLLADEYFETELLFTSPSGDGLKWIIPADLSEVSHQEYFKAVAAYILDSYNLEVDNSGKDISRACFLPHDPEAFINPIYLNFRVKELLLQRGISSQVIDAGKVRQALRNEIRYDYYLNNIAIAILAKLNGIPWQLNTKLKRELVVGVGAFKSIDTDIQYLGSAFCFTNNGQFNQFKCFRKNEIDELAGSIISKVKEFAGINPDLSRLVIHFYKNMSKKELEPIEKGLRNLGLNIPVFIVSINKTESQDITAFDNNWKDLMPMSGTFINIGFNRFLMFNNTRYGVNGYKSSDGYPFPIKLSIKCTHEELENDYQIIKGLIDQVYQFSRIYWKSVRQQNLPVTIKYPELVAEIIPHFQSKDIDFGQENLWFL